MLAWLKRLVSSQALDDETYKKKFQLALLVCLYPDVLAGELGEERSVDAFTTDDSVLDTTRHVARFTRHTWPADKTLTGLHRKLVQWLNGRVDFFALLQQQPLPIGRVTRAGQLGRERKERFGRELLSLGEERAQELLGGTLTAAVADHFGLGRWAKEPATASELYEMLTASLDLEQGAGAV